ncbi:hypothetical protein XELAEV_18041710mg [Xenopus laevis]|uniref:Uncharacterized protein n=1 Tax=Xenopus laevis TaxID=8355 RepID=A0A974C2P8_XENLA|nr:hypothetical protein XELAEV_18041710mg [Xenopus laevis]
MTRIIINEVPQLQHMRILEVTSEFHDLIRYIDLELHGLTLAEYHRKQWIPRGLRVSLRPTLFANVDDYSARFAQILNKCSADIMVLTLEYIKKELTTVQMDITRLEEEVKRGGTEEDFTTLKEQLSEKLDCYRKEREKQKRSKFDRDALDYKGGFKTGKLEAKKSMHIRPRPDSQHPHFKHRESKATPINNEMPVTTRFLV